MTPPTVYLGLGGNLGKPRRQIEQAMTILEEQDVCMQERSSWYDTEPVHVEGQPWFINLVVRAETSLEPLALLDACQAAERAVGRRPSVRFGPRHIDIDILLYADRCIRSERLTVPHPRMRERRFVLAPLLEIAPDLEDPVSHEPFADILSRLDEGKKVLRSLINES